MSDAQDTTTADADFAGDAAAPIEDPRDGRVVLFRYADDGRFRFGVPRRDLYAEDVARLDPATLKDVTARPPGGGEPMYAPAEGKAAMATVGGPSATAAA